ncbi:TAT-variant-translocated molybdopterin oxidoreductase [Adhaeribacter pallidiroseus]|uniref:Hdr-like menaquinol oxidoreductase iron-sulfur subunit n=1 Tax=Adhaeribacter pallidiroseus TaxID=2072847 RepID=A0A369QAS2_9BACT|nr:TAT-variant-translocated molybdopterin oxidoreductase [Adhaeribacter pallidiroseus]RDC61552.1 Hdr-like menaquinol oxidoreductase iron-sulfur subunit [Adhaeribacter pallidiroseus]
MQETIKYWKGLEELENTPEFNKTKHNEFAEFLPVKETNQATNKEVAPRRDFLKLLGFGIAATTLASCEAPVRRAIPYLNKPEEVDPGIANWYASTYFVGSDYNSVIVKTREGRPIKLEGNTLSPVTKGGLSARAQASVLSLYDKNRLKAPLAGGKPATWEKVDGEITSKLRSVRGKVAIVSNTIISPTTKRAIAEFGRKFTSFEHVMYDPNSASGLLKANGGVIPGFDFSKARVIVSISADFLGTWLSPVEYAKQYITTRKVSKTNPTMSRHYQFESMLTLTGANADIRVPVKPSEQSLVVAALYNRIVSQPINTPAYNNARLDAAAKELLANKGAALVVAGSNDPAVQMLVAEINRTLGAEGTTIGTTPSLVRQGDDASMIRLINEMNAGTIGAIIFYGANPIYDHPQSEKILSGIQKVPLSIALTDRIDETATRVAYVCPDHNYLESWNDFEPKRGQFSFSQPAISPLFQTRQAQESLLRWSGNNTSYYDYLQNNWRGVFGSQAAWDKAIHDGVYSGTGVSSPGTTTPTAPAMTIAAAAVSINKAASAASRGIEAVIYEKVNIGPGREANNPWLQENPDPITKATWDNYVTLPRTLAVEMGVEQNDILSVSANGVTFELPALIQPGQAKGSVGIATGYGRTQAGPAANGVGANAYKLISVNNNGLVYGNTVSLKKTGAQKPIAQTQTHHTIMDRLVVQESTLDKYKKDPKSVTEYIKIATPEGAQTPAKVSLWQDYEYKNHHWGMVIDLNSCIGCTSCSVACQVENNIAVVGKQEVLNRREMHWLRIDRYYSSDAHKTDEGKGTVEKYHAMEEPSENPSVIFQPMLCQHCNHAPCETVCPVAATMHSSEGINQMVYNRCVGTRYCANNCPYKVRRFNWFAYYDNEKFAEQNPQMNSDLGRMVLNPDVTVRARGVMEKCSFCVQRIQLGKLEAKKQNRRPKDGEIITACAQSCPTNAIVFGDMKDPDSQVSQILREQQGERAFHVLEEINVQPNVTYLTKIRNLV